MKRENTDTGPLPCLKSPIQRKAGPGLTVTIPEPSFTTVLTYRVPSDRDSVRNSKCRVLHPPEPALKREKKQNEPHRNRDHELISSALALSPVLLLIATAFISFFRIGSTVLGYVILSR